MNLIPSMFLLNKHKQIWQWPYCNNRPKTLSFRATTDHGPVFMNPNKELLVEPEAELITLGSLFTNSSEYSPSDSTESDSSAVETIVRGARSERLFFEPDSTSSILDIQGSATQCTSENTGGDDDGDDGGGGGGGGDDGGGCLSYKESMAVVMETENPYVEFKKSMEEMVEIYGLKDWDCLEELLGWYLRMNVKDNHEFIVGAFFDLLAGISGGDGDSGGDGGDGDGGGGGGGEGYVSCVDHFVASLSSGASTCSSPISSPSGIK